MKNTAKDIFFVYFLLASILLGGERVAEKDLGEKYKDFLKLTHYIILPQEKEVFMRLTNDRERDVFIEAFWRQRDPTKGTPQNEYKDEQIERFLYANRRFRRGTPREGWMTDMGRIYIILGPPASIERFEGVSGIRSCQTWYYYGDKNKGQPTYFALVFYQRGGSGEFKLYNPVSDGPASLLVETQGLDLTNFHETYSKVKELAPTLASVSVSIIPGELPYNYQPSPRNNIILANILESPKKDVSASYATHFLNYRGVVSTDYLTNYIETDADIAMILDPLLNINFLHFSISPKSVSIDYFEPKDKYYCNFQLNVSLRKGGNIIFQYSKDFPFYFDKDDIERIRGSGISIQDSFPLVEGEYKLSILILNSVGKEFSVYEKDIAVPEQSDLPQITGPVLAYKVQDYSSDLNIPFKFLNKKLLVDPKNTFSTSENIAFFFTLTNVSKALWVRGKVEVIIQSFARNNPLRKFIVLNLKDYPYKNILGILHSISAKDLTPAYYEVNLILKNGKAEIVDKKTSHFILSHKKIVPHTATLYKAFPLSNYFLYFYSVAYQYDKVNKIKKAEANYKKAYSIKPDYKQGLMEYARFLIRNKKFAQSLELIEKVKDDEKIRFEYYLIKGKSCMGMERYEEAIENFLEGNKIYNSDTGLLNSLGACYFKIGKKGKALEVLRASLRLNPAQRETEALIKKMEEGVE